MKHITLEKATMMALGSSIYSTGGGFELAVQRKLFTQLFTNHDSLSLVSIDELKDEDYICTAYGVGSAGNTDFDLSIPLKIGMKQLETFTKKKFTAIFAGETNIDVLAFQAAANVGLPVLDADCTGGRAVPEIQFDNFIISGTPITPVVAVTYEGEVAILENAKDGIEVETFVRSLSGKSKTGVVAVLDHPVQVKVAKHILTLGIFERALRLGELITHSQKTKALLKKVVKEVGGSLLFEGEVTDVQTVDDRKEGFLKGFYSMTDKKGHLLKVLVKNENIICWINEKPLLTPPDALLTIDLETFDGIHNSKITKGQKIAVITKKATPLWRTEAGINAFSPKHFGFDIPTIFAS